MTLRLFFVLIFFLTALVACKGSHTAVDLKEEKFNIILIVIDTLGAKHLEAYDSKIKNSPNIAKLASEGGLFKNAYAPAPWTKPSVASIFTSKMPSEHKLRDLNDTLSTEYKTIAEYLQEKKYQTFGRVSHIFLSDEHGFSKGFEDYGVVPFEGNVHNAITSHRVSNAAIDWLSERVAGNKPATNETNNSEKIAADAPFFMFLHYFDPHYNFRHHPDFDRTSSYKGKLEPGMDIRKLRKLIPQLTKEDIDYLIGLYHEEIAFTDFQIGRVLEHLKKTKLADNTMIIITSDHGEEFMEHDYLGHTRTLYDELINVPLIISWPGKIKPQVISENVSTIDILPTLLDALEIKSNKPLSGVSLLQTLRGKNNLQRDREILAEVDFRSSKIKAYKAGLKKDNLKIIYDKPTTAWELHDLEKDPQELNNQMKLRPGEFEALKPKLQSFIDSQGELADPKSRKFQSPQEVEQLKSLGYM